MPVQLLTIGMGGMAGAWARYRVSIWIHGRSGAAFPWGTLTVNVFGCFLLGLILPLLDNGAVSPMVRGFVTAGLVGAFTTFSTFALDAVILYRDGRWFSAVVYVAASVGLGILGLAAGLAGGSAL
jgi:fluoride exporter